MRRLAAAVLLGASSVVAAADRTPANLVADLASAEFRTRDSAARALDALGEAALPALKDGAASPNPELATRAGDLAARIAERAENARRIAPTLVELDYRDVPLERVLADLERQTRYTFFVPPDAAPPLRDKIVRVRTGGKVPFWAAIELVNAAAETTLAAAGPPVTVANVYRNPNDPAASRVPYVAFVTETARKAEADRRAALDTAAKTAATAAAAEAFVKQLEEKAQAALQKQAPQPAKPVPQAMPVAANPAPAAFVAPPNGVYLVPVPPATGPNPPPKPPTFVHLGGAVRVEVSPVPESLLPEFNRDTAPLNVSVIAEPKLPLQTLRDLRVTRCVSDEGFAVYAHMIDPLTAVASDVRNGMVVQRGINGLVIRRSVAAPYAQLPMPLQRVLKLKAPESGLAKLAELAGVVTATITSPETVAVTLTDFTADALPLRGEQGVTLRAVHAEPTAKDTAAHLYDVQLLYPYGKVTPSGVLAQNGYAAEAGQAFNGLRLFDAAGKPYLLTGSGNGRNTYPRVVTYNGDRYYQLAIRVAAKPPGDDPLGPPARMTFSGTWPVGVEIPFGVKDVPTATGTGAK